MKVLINQMSTRRHLQVYGCAQSNVTQLLKLTIICANLPKPCARDKYNPYVRIALVGSQNSVTDLVGSQSLIDIARTKVRKRTLNPQWNEVFFIHVKPNLDKLVLTVLDNNMLMRDTVFGTVELDLGTTPRFAHHILKQGVCEQRSMKGVILVAHSYVSRTSEADLMSITANINARVPQRNMFLDRFSKLLKRRSVVGDKGTLSDQEIVETPITLSRHYSKNYKIFVNSLPKPPITPEYFQLLVSRDSIVEESFQAMSQVTNPEVLRAELRVTFFGEDGSDLGGLTKEWFCLVAKKLCNPDYGLFEYSSTDNFQLQINPLSGLCNERHLMYFRFLGRLAGMAAYHSKMLDVFFTRPFYKTLLKKTIKIEDIREADIMCYKSWKWILENDPTDLGLTFSTDEGSLGFIHQIDLLPGGSNIPVTSENKHQYINALLESRFVTRTESQMDEFRQGFHEVVPIEKIVIFNENELELLLCGTNEVDVNDWKENTVYTGGYFKKHKVIVWFWKAVLSFTSEERLKLLQFVTGTSRVPVNGFKGLSQGSTHKSFTIECWGKSDHLPRSHTCANKIDLPPYTSYKQLKAKIKSALELTEGFFFT
ncbi:E3 ubiquitin-protein ligase NEDD4-like [Artemia franciscana]|uniref:HECT-type E3 ubiquitin transferase n=1 Tax=Artemia franciscana TaxID=6661 RepID=A0AA88HCX5_ARTSF|nr:hypothetical protein QYM36_017276 [Artemia franciscana]